MIARLTPNNTIGVSVASVATQSMTLRLTPILVGPQGAAGTNNLAQITANQQLSNDNDTKLSELENTDYVTLLENALL